MMILLKILSKKIFKLFHEFHDLLLVIFGGSCISFILYNRLRYRIPKTLPIDLSPENLLFYVIIICSITFMLYLNFYFILKKEITKATNIYVNVILENYYKSLDKIFNIIEYILNYFLKITLKDLCSEIFSRFFKNHHKYNKYVFYLEIVPRVIILCLFVIDIFYVKKLHYFYISLLLFLVPLLIRCFIYVLQRTFNDTIESLNHKLDVYIEDYNINDDLLPPTNIAYYFEQKLLYSLGKRKDPIRYNINISFDHMKELYNIFDVNRNKELNTKEIVKFYVNIIDSKLLPLAYFSNKYNEIKQMVLPKINLILFGTYFIGWSYIIITSHKIFPEDYFLFLEKILNYEEPFSGSNIINTSTIDENITSN